MPPELAGPSSRGKRRRGSHSRGSATGRLASVSIALPSSSMPARAARRRQRWLADHRELSLHGRGVPFATTSRPERFQLPAPAGRLGAQTLRRSPWFSVSVGHVARSCTVDLGAASAPAHRPRRTIVTFSAQTDATPPAESRTQRGCTSCGNCSSARPSRGTRPTRSSPRCRTPDAARLALAGSGRTAAIADGQIRKVVLGASPLSSGSRIAVVPAGARRAARPHSSGCYVAVLSVGAGLVVAAASPELLARKRDRCLVSHALAGTARRYATTARRQRARASALLSVAQGAARACGRRRRHCRAHGRYLRAVAHPPRRRCCALRFLQHLWTPVSGRLRPARACSMPCASASDAGGAGVSRRARLATGSRRIGERRDGLYSGVAGWINADGDGDAVVVLRSAYVEDRTAVALGRRRNRRGIRSRRGARRNGTEARDACSSPADRMSIRIRPRSAGAQTKKASSCATSRSD